MDDEISLDEVVDPVPIRRDEFGPWLDETTVSVIVFVNFEVR